MLKLITTTQFRKDLKCIKKRVFKLDSLEYVLSILQKQEELLLKYKDHNLIGNYNGFR